MRQYRCADALSLSSGARLYRRRIDVLVEKPLTAEIDEARELVAAARQKNVILQVGHLERFNPAIRRLEGVVKNPKFVECHRLAPFIERGTDVDVVLDLMIHDIDVIASLVRSPVVRVEAVGVPVLTDKPDIANARITFANGCIANVTSSRVSLKRERKCVFFSPMLIFRSTTINAGHRFIISRRPAPAGSTFAPRI
jgi:predicted dehydrogenase